MRDMQECGSRSVGFYGKQINSTITLFHRYFGRITNNNNGPVDDRQRESARAMAAVRKMVI